MNNNTKPSVQVSTSPSILFPPVWDQLQQRILKPAGGSAEDLRKEGMNLLFGCKRDGVDVFLVLGEQT